jgi:hypothetical protein
MVSEEHLRLASSYRFIVGIFFLSRFLIATACSRATTLLILNHFLGTGRIPGSTNSKGDGCVNARQLACWVTVPKIVASEHFVPSRVLPLRRFFESQFVF